jgi:16S rRNA (adenine1518-N6/adenine1519-N6)-dimethyltransferase
MKPSEIKEILKTLGGGANKHLGQHFLIEERVLQAMLQSSGVKYNDFVLEIGPGLGVLSKVLLEAGANIVALERDARFVAYLQTRFITEKFKVIRADAVQEDWETIFSNQSWKLVANLPYAITSFVLRKVLWMHHLPERVTVLVQREVAERAVARDGKTSLLSLMIALASSEAKIVTRVSRGAFFPPPKVESAILDIQPLSWEKRQEHWGIHPEKMMLLAKQGFAHPRKLLVSNLKLSIEENAVMKKLELNPKARAEDLSPRDWARLTIALNK